MHDDWNMSGFPTPDELRVWLVSRVGRDRRSVAGLLAAVAPFLVTIYAREDRDAGLDDLVHETLLKIYRQREGLDPLCPFSMWLLEVTRHEMAEYFRLPPSGRRPPTTGEAIATDYRVIESADRGGGA